MSRKVETTVIALALAAAVGSLCGAFRWLGLPIEDVRTALAASAVLAVLTLRDRR